MMLALRMGRTLSELGSTMSSQEFSLWLAMYDDDQWGDERTDFRADLRAGIIAATIANYAGKERSKDAAPAIPADFMPQRQKDEPEPEPDPVTFFTAVANSKKFDKG